jgi:hypothetical protein
MHNDVFETILSTLICSFRGGILRRLIASDLRESREMAIATRVSLECFGKSGHLQEQDRIAVRIGVGCGYDLLSMVVASLILVFWQLAKAPIFGFFAFALQARSISASAKEEMLSELSCKLIDLVSEACQTGKGACGLTSCSKARLKGCGNFEDVWGIGDLL